MRVTWRTGLLPRVQVGILADEAPALLWLAVGAPDSDDSIVLVEVPLPRWWPVRRRAAGVAGR